MIELLFKAYKNDIELSTTNVQHNFSVIGAEFINFIATLITRKVINKLTDKGLLNNDTFGGITEDLTMAWRRHLLEDDLNTTLKSTDKKWIHTNMQTMEMLIKLDLCEK